jgi:hypothetical protein
LIYLSLNAIEFKMTDELLASNVWISSSDLVSSAFPGLLVLNLRFGHLSFSLGLNFLASWVNFISAGLEYLYIHLRLDELVSLAGLLRLLCFQTMPALCSLLYEWNHFILVLSRRGFPLSICTFQSNNIINCSQYRSQWYFGWKRWQTHMAI